MKARIRQAGLKANDPQYPNHALSEEGTALVPGRNLIITLPSGYHIQLDIADDQVTVYPEAAIQIVANHVRVSSDNPWQAIDSGMEHGEGDPVRHPICPVSMFFEGDEDKCHTKECDWDTDTRSCNKGCQPGLPEGSDTPIIDALCPIKRHPNKAFVGSKADRDIHTCDWDIDTGTCGDRCRKLGILDEQDAGVREDP